MLIHVGGVLRVRVIRLAFDPGEGHPARVAHQMHKIEIDARYQREQISMNWVFGGIDEYGATGNLIDGSIQCFEHLGVLTELLV